MTLQQLKEDLAKWENSSCFLNSTLWISENMVDPHKLPHRVSLSVFDFEEIREIAMKRIKSEIFKIGQHRL